MPRRRKRPSLVAQAVEARRNPYWTRIESAYRVRRRVGQRQRLMLATSLVLASVLAALVAAVLVILAVMG